MIQQKQPVEQQLKDLFYGFVDAGLNGRVSETVDFISESYIGVGMGEQGIIRSKEEIARIIREDYRLAEGASIRYEVRDFTIRVLKEGAAIILGELVLTNISPDGTQMHSGLMQTIGACDEGDRWRIAFTHASPTIITAESIEAYPISFMDNTMSSLLANLQTKVVTHQDPLTGIFNREGFELRSAELMKEYNPKHNTALLMVDLDDFKQINDRLGHQTGDDVLKQVAGALSNTFGDGDAVGRIGGDEFMVLLTGNFSVKFLEQKAEELLDSIYLHTEDNKTIKISVSIGVAYGRSRITFEKLYHNADIAMYTAKKAGKCRYSIINYDTNSQHGCGAGTNLISLQTLLNHEKVETISPSKTPYEALVENIPGGVVMFEFVGDDVKITHCNEWFSRLLGYTEQETFELQNDNPLIFVHPDDIPLVLAAVQAIKDGADTSNIIYRARHKSGQYLHINQITTVTERSNDSIIMYGIESDVEEVISLKHDVEYAHKVKF